MIIIMEKGATEEQIEAVIEKLIGLDFNVHRSTGEVHTVLGAVGPSELVDPDEFKVMPGVMECHRVMTPYQRSGRAAKPERTVIRLASTRAGEVEVGGSRVVMMAGPGSVEGEEQLFRCAELAARGGAKLFRAGGLRAHLSPMNAAAPDAEALRLMRRAADTFGMLLAGEVAEASQVGLVEEHADVLLIGSRNMQNYPLLRAAGRARKPVLLKRGAAATVQELLVSADMILEGGNEAVMLCERGVRTYGSYTKNTLDVTAIPVLHKLSHLPVLADPCRAAGRRDLALPLAAAAVAAGADGVLVDVHPDPSKVLAEGAQSLEPAQLLELARLLKALAAAMGRSF
ncbi:MAG: 3-deoxy-7-phosphoheptulonate synthase [Bryobacteraceae bacterium]